MEDKIMMQLGKTQEKSKYSHNSTIVFGVASQFNKLHKIEEDEKKRQDGNRKEHYSIIKEEHLGYKSIETWRD